MRQQYVLGDAIYRQYPYFFKSPTFNDSVYVLADVVQRCIQSATSQFFGIYQNQGPELPDGYPSGRAIPPYNSSFLDRKSNKMTKPDVFPSRFYPAIINYVTTPAETLLFNTDSSTLCPITRLWQAENLIDTKAQEAWNAFQPLIQYLNSFGVNLTNGAELISFGDTFFCDYYDNRALPFGIPYSDDLVTNMSYAFSWWMAHVWEGQPIQQQSNAYGFANGFIDYLQGYLNGSQPAQFILLSGHDDNIHTLLTPLGIVYDDCVMANYLAFWENGTTPYPNCHFPWFASTLKYELYNDTIPYIKFYYEDNLIPLCNGGDCSVQEFIGLMQTITGNVTFDQWNATCYNVSTTFDNSDDGFLSSTKGLICDAIETKTQLEFDWKDITIIGLILISVSLGGFLVFDRKRHHQELERTRTTLLF
jgi:hypothetical protein